MHIKICGLSTEQAIDAAVEAGANHVGFVHFERSPRHVSLEDIAALGAYCGERTTRWIVLASPSDQLLETLRDMHSQQRAPFDGLQIHGQVNEALVDNIANAAMGPQIMRAHAVATVEDVAAVTLQTHADAYLFDAKPAPDDTLPGGNGRSFDWSILKGLDVARLNGRPWLLAGGLTADNVAEAIAQSGARGVDVSSGVESAPGVKDVSHIAEFVRAAKSAL